MGRKRFCTYVHRNFFLLLILIRGIHPLIFGFISGHSTHIFTWFRFLCVQYHLRNPNEYFDTSRKQINKRMKILLDHSTLVLAYSSKNKRCLSRNMKLFLLSNQDEVLFQISVIPYQLTPQLLVFHHVPFSDGRFNWLLNSTQKSVVSVLCSFIKN